MNDQAEDQRSKRLLSPESANTITPDKFDKRQRHNMETADRSRAPRQDTTRRNCVIEGQKGVSGDEMVTNLLLITSRI